MKTDGKIKGGLKRKLIVNLLDMAAKSREGMAQYAFDNTRFYKELYHDLPEIYGSVKEVPFRKLPIVKKSLVNSYLPLDLLSTKEEKRVFKYAETTGSTGSPTPSFYTHKEFKGSVVLARLTPYKDMLKGILAENRRAVCGLACGFTIAGASFQQLLNTFGFMTINVDARTTIAPPERVARLLARFKPSVVVASETDFLAWMRVLKEFYSSDYDEVVNNLKLLMSTAELCSESRSRQIAETFGLVHIDNYACVEGYFSLPCPCGEKHILPIYETEVLSSDLKMSSTYGTGRFAFTNLLRKSTPFVRYLLDDLVTIAPSSCPYGFKKSIKPHGRYELSVKIGDRRYGTEHFEEQLFKDYLFGEYQIQVKNGGLTIYAEDYLDKGVPVKKIEERFEEKFGQPTDLNVVPYGTLRDYQSIRKSKPLLRLQDERAVSTQKIPRYM